jgi:hypothetical protein
MNRVAFFHSFSSVWAGSCHTEGTGQGLHHQIVRCEPEEHSRIYCPSAVVFDAAQTDGELFPDLAGVKGDSQHYTDRLEAFFRAKRHHPRLLGSRPCQEWHSDRMSGCRLNGTEFGDWPVVTADDNHITVFDLIEIAREMGL